MAIIRYDGGGRPGGVVKESISHDGGKTWSGSGSSGYSNAGNKGNVPTYSGSNNTGGSSSVATQWNNYQGATGKQYNVAGSNGTIQVTYKDGTTRTVRPTDSDYAVTKQSMESDLRGNGVNYTPTHNFTNQNGSYQTKDYVNGNSALQYALQQAVKNNGGGSVSTEDYAKSLYNRIGTAKADGSGVVTLQDVNNELNRLGLSDYASDKAIYTASGKLLPGNELLTQHFGSDGSNSDNSLWWTYGGHDYLAGANGGDSSNWAQYVNGKTGNLDNLSFIFGDMQNNPYAQQDPDFMAAYNNALNNFNNVAGITGATTPVQNIPTNVGGTGFTGNANVDSVIDLINSQNSYAQAAGLPGYSGGDILEQISQLLNSGKDAYSDFIAAQKQQAQDAATAQARQAWVNSRQAQRQMADALSAQGLGTSGAMQQSQLGIQNDYSSNLNTINSTLSQALNSLTGQELQLLSDYYNNMANYTYQYNDAEANRAIQRQQLALEQQRAAYEQQYQQQQLALQQAQMAWQQQQAEREYENSLNQQAYNQKLQQAALYGDMYNYGALGDMGYVNALSNLGLISAGYWPNGSYTSGATEGQLNRQLAQAQLQGALLNNESQRLTNVKKSRF